MTNVTVQRGTRSRIGSAPLRPSDAVHPRRHPAPVRVTRPPAERGAVPPPRPARRRPQLPPRRLDLRRLLRRALALRPPLRADRRRALRQCVRMARAPRVLARPRLPADPPRHPVRAAGVARDVRDRALAAQQPGVGRQRMGPRHLRGEDGRVRLPPRRAACDHPQPHPARARAARPHRELPSRGRAVVRVGRRPRVARPSGDPHPRAEVGWLALLVAIPGILGGLAASGNASTAMQRFVILQAIPYHTDPFFGGETWPGAQVVLHVACRSPRCSRSTSGRTRSRTRTSPNGSSPRSRSRRRSHSRWRTPPAPWTSGATSGSCRCGRSRS